MKKLFVFLCIVILFGLMGPSSASAERFLPFYTDEVVNRLNFLKENTPWIKSGQEWVFDCSNMSTSLTFLFPEYETKIVEGMLDTPKMSTKGNVLTVKIVPVRHAAVKIKISGSWFWIEPTTLELWRDYVMFHPELYFKDFQQAIIKHGEYGWKEYGLSEEFLQKNQWLAKMILMHLRVSDAETVLATHFVYPSLTNDGESIKQKTQSFRTEKEGFIVLEGQDVSFLKQSLQDAKIPYLVEDLHDNIELSKILLRNKYICYDEITKQIILGYEPETTAIVKLRDTLSSSNSYSKNDQVGKMKSVLLEATKNAYSNQ